MKDASRRRGDARRGGWVDMLVRIALLALVWWALVEGEGGGWLLAGAIVGAALFASLRLVPRADWRLEPGGIIRFVPFFLWQSAAGGIDVARRAFHPRLPLAAGFIDHASRLPPGPSRLFFTGIVSLLPGTLSVELIEPRGPDAEVCRLRVHLLDADAPAREKLRELEVRVADVFGVDRESPSPAPRRDSGR